MKNDRGPKWPSAEELAQRPQAVVLGEVEFRNPLSKGATLAGEHVTAADLRAWMRRMPTSDPDGAIAIHLLGCTPCAKALEDAIRQELGRPRVVTRYPLKECRPFELWPWEQAPSRYRVRRRLRDPAWVLVSHGGADVAAREALVQALCPSGRVECYELRRAELRILEDG